MIGFHYNKTKGVETLEEIKKEFFSLFKKYGVFGAILLYFLIQDNETRKLDREDRKKNIVVMETLVEKVNETNTRVTVIETKLEKAGI